MLPIITCFDGHIFVTVCFTSLSQTVLVLERVLANTNAYINNPK